MGPHVTVPCVVGKEDDVRRLEGLGLGLVLGAHQNAVLELLRKAVEVLGVVGLRARDVNDDDRLLVVQVRHVHDAALQHDALVLKDDVLREAGLALVSDGVVDPDDVAVVRGLGDLVENLLLPRARDKIFVAGSFLQLLRERLQALVEFDVRGGAVLRDALNAAGLEGVDCVGEVVAASSTALGELAALEGAGLIAGNTSILLTCVIARLIARALARLEVRGGEPALDSGEGLGARELDVALDVLRSIVAALELPRDVALRVEARGEIAAGERGVVDGEAPRAVLDSGHR